MSPPRHPHELRAGDFVRDFRIVRRLGVGGFSFVFLVERGGLQFSLKMAARPLSAEDPDQVDSWMRREVASMDHLVGHPLVLPVFEWSLLSQLFSPALSIALLAGIESLLSALVADGMTGRRHRSKSETAG